MAKRILALISGERQIDSLCQEMSEVTAGGHEMFRPAEIRLMDEYIQVAEFPRREVP